MTAMIERCFHVFSVFEVKPAPWPIRQAVRLALEIFKASRNRSGLPNTAYLRV
jgi:hypothetical protein